MIDFNDLDVLRHYDIPNLTKGDPSLPHSLLGMETYRKSTLSHGFSNEV